MSSASTELFSNVRPRLMAIGYRMLSSVQEAEDLVQDAWLRWHEETKSSQTHVLNAEAWLVTVTTRMAIDRLRAAKLRRATYEGAWFPEPILEQAPTTPEQACETADDVSIAFLLLLDCLSPEARAAFLLREVFDAEYEQIAEAIGRSEASARQIVHRAKRRLENARGSAGTKALPMPAPAQLELLRRLVHSISSGNLGDIKMLLAEEAEMLGDFGDVRPSFTGPLLGAQRIAQLYFAMHRRHGDAMRLELAKLNGEWALLRYLDGALDSVQTFEFTDVQVARVRIQRNPVKLARLKAKELVS
ncbi:sigma-70 family RNA polymerase sigma factor [Variovorax paradoxus]|uniref:sigma-70 family RNA polymerase sigma factor n=1 Tax=Variovorax TaxID=34072 RepID=UPI00285FA780|nr:sigma-70 family RNA polymerase sigma factor [Variovorax paradoxus]MDR6523762.1 RNA polymerase sigma-70 factor (ECF subfamily) [Variovorax paradoxus]